MRRRALLKKEQGSSYDFSFLIDLLDLVTVYTDDPDYELENTYWTPSTQTYSLYVDENCCTAGSLFQFDIVMWDRIGDTIPSPSNPITLSGSAASHFSARYYDPETDLADMQVNRASVVVESILQSTIIANSYLTISWGNLSLTIYFCYKSGPSLNDLPYGYEITDVVCDDPDYELDYEGVSNGVWTYTLYMDEEAYSEGAFLSFEILAHNYVDGIPSDNSPVTLGGGMAGDFDFVYYDPQYDLADMLDIPSSLCVSTPDLISFINDDDLTITWGGNTIHIIFRYK